MKLRHILAALAVITFTAQAQKEAAPHDYVRYVGDDKRGKLETSIVTMTNDAGVKVDLIGAVHIADAPYYKTLKELFTGYDVLLFELVDGQRLKDDFEGKAPKKPAAEKPAVENPAETVPQPKPVKKSEPAVLSEEKESDPAFALIRGMMQGLSSYFRFSYQTDGIDYSAKNFVHADVSLAEFQRLMDEKGESFATMFLKAMQMQMRRGPRPEDEPKGGQILLAFLGDSSGMKVAMARMLGQAESIGADVGFGSDSVIVGERNRVALEVFDRELKAGRKNMGIFYGAAHLDDMEKRLEKRGFKRTAERWLTAWDIKPLVDLKK